MPRLILKGWGILVDFTWDVIDNVIDAARNTTNNTDVDLENKVVNIVQRGQIVYTSKELIRNLVINVTFNLLL